MEIETLGKRVCGIYKITSPSGKIYIGQSRCLKDRWVRYRKHHCKSQPKLYNSFMKYGFAKHIFEVIEMCLFEELNIKERYWQDYYDVLGEKGLNLVLTATDTLPVVVSEATRKKLRENMLGNTYSTGVVPSEETRRKIGSAQIGVKNHRWGKKNSKEHIEAIKKSNIGESNFFFGKNHTEASKKKMSESQKVRIRSQEEINRFKNLQKEVVARMSHPVLNLQTGIFYDSISEASRTLGTTSTVLGRKLRGVRRNNTDYILC